MTLTSYIATLTITQGAGAGELIRLLPWQRRFLRGAFAVDGDASLSISRGNGKSTLVAAVACAAIDGPLRQPRGEVVCVASSFAQGKIIFEHVLAFLHALGHDLSDRTLWRVQDSANVATIEHRPSGARVRCIGSDPKRAHGLAPLLVLSDEPAQWEAGKRDAMRAALSTSMGKVPNSRLISLGTRPADDEHWFTKMLDGGSDYSQSHHASDTDSPFRKSTWLKANPSLPAMPALEKRIRKEATAAKRDASMLASFTRRSDSTRAPQTPCKRPSSMQAHGDVSRVTWIVPVVAFGGSISGNLRPWQDVRPTGLHLVGWKQSQVSRTLQG